MRRGSTRRRVIAVFAALSAAVALAGPSRAETAALPAPADPLRLYGNEIRFDVLRNGDKVGYHLVQFHHTADGLRVESRAEIAVKLWFVSAYSFRYQSIEQWRGGILSSFHSSTNDNGEFTRVEARRLGGKLEVRTGDSGWQAVDVVPPTTHWNMAQIKAPAVLNTLTGNLNRVAVADAGLETVTLADGPRQARRFVYSGDLTVEAWYDAAGRWVKLRFPAEDGSTIEYVCRRCDGPMEVTGIE